MVYSGKLDVSKYLYGDGHHDCQLDWIWNKPKDTLLGGSVKTFPGKMN